MHFSFSPEPGDAFFTESVKELRKLGVSLQESVLFALYWVVYGHIAHAAEFEAFWEELPNIGEIDLSTAAKSFYNQALPTYRGNFPKETAERAYKLLELSLTEITLVEKYRAAMNFFFNKMLERIKREAVPADGRLLATGG